MVWAGLSCELQMDPSTLRHECCNNAALHDCCGEATPWRLSWRYVAVAHVQRQR